MLLYLHATFCDVLINLRIFKPDLLKKGNFYEQIIFYTFNLF